MANLAAKKPEQRPHFAYLHHISLPCRNLAESKRFYTEVLGGTLIHDVPGFAEVRLGGMIVGMSEQPGGWTGATAEYPHYGFNVDGANFALARKWFEACGVPQHGWTRNYKVALLYFRDPSGNLLELYCESGYEAIRELALGPLQGGVPLPLEALNYRWSGKAGDPALRPRIDSLNHLSMPVRDIAQAKRFWIDIFGAEPVKTSDPTTFTEVRLAGAIVGLSIRGDGVATGRSAEYPHYAFYADAENFLPMIEHLKAHGVVTPGPWTRDGKKGLMYFKDPSGNLFEIYCGGEFAAAARFPRGAKQGGNYVTDYPSLNYDWRG